jgi:hypothetical protein
MTEHQMTWGRDGYKILAAGLLIAALSAAASTVAWAACPFWCTTGERMGDVRAGMTKDQVIAVLGRPDGYAQSGSTEALTYSNRLMSGFSWDRADYHVMFSSGIVTAYGPGTVRQNSAPGNIRTLVLIPIR